jgi:glycine C-acetyltransferase/8-amino-7-oxononanoate synthase
VPGVIDVEGRVEVSRAEGGERKMRSISGPQGPRVLVDGRPVLLLCSDNALGFADHPRVREAAADAAMRWGVGAGGARLVSGNMTVHRRLEQRLAGFHGAERCLLFPSGGHAAAGVLGGLAGPGDVILSDAANHPAVVDACRLADAQALEYDHGDLDHLEWALRGTSGREAVVVTDGVFGVEGDVAPLEGIVETAGRHGARLVVNESFATGTQGPGGRGTVAAAGLEDEVDVILGSLGKALGSAGGFACCERSVAQLLLAGGRGLLHSTAPPPPAAAGALAALDLLLEQPQRVDKLARNGRVLRDQLAEAGIDPGASSTHILAVPVAGPRRAARAADGALRRGILVDALSPPAVSRERAGIRLTVMSSHTRTEMRSAAAALASVLADIAQADRPRVFDGLVEAA